jgi:hypothetical protein
MSSANLNLNGLRRVERGNSPETSDCSHQPSREWIAELVAVYESGKSIND